MATHDNYDKSILKQLTRIANALDRINKCLDNSTVITNDNTKICSTVDYAKEHPEWVEQINKIAAGEDGFVKVLDWSSDSHEEKKTSPNRTFNV